ncbi:hypothetical protein [Nitrosomonas sp. sh817]|uniref:hypothetical protein n=1 Tax=Nitrosomonas sp. sh817 TaxID=3070658 RepID=UPI0027DB2F2F|nr:hypothetical protein [Nitrosomonas sp. sh817]WMJ08630.1 hypothetical protein RBH92_00025 [Nitrosomonas sp. sh817]
MGITRLFGAIEKLLRQKINFIGAICQNLRQLTVIRFIANEKLAENKAPRRKQRGIKSALQTAGFQPAFAPRGEELNPEEIDMNAMCITCSSLDSRRLPSL